jgi:hypothetical protein
MTRRHSVESTIPRLIDSTSQYCIYCLGSCINLIAGALLVNQLRAFHETHSETIRATNHQTDAAGSMPYP